MTTGMSEDEIYEQAKKGFYWNLAAYLVVNPVLVIIWAFPAGGGYPWFLWALGGWGIGVLLHFLGVFVFGPKWDRGAIEKEAERIKKEQR